MASSYVGIVATQRQLRHAWLMSAETGVEQMGKRPGTTAVAGTDGDDVNLVTTSASGELPNHPEANGGRAYGETKPTILNPSKNRVSALNRTHGRPAQIF